MELLAGGTTKGNDMSYEAWRISYQSSEQAARAAYNEMMKLRGDCAEAYQVVGAGMWGDPCPYTQRDVERALDNLSAAANGMPRPHADLLPWPQ